MPKKSRMLIDTTTCRECGSGNFIEVDGEDRCAEHGHVYDSSADALRLQQAGIAAGFKLHIKNRKDA